MGILKTSVYPQINNKSLLTMATKPLSEALVDHEPLATPTLYHRKRSVYTWYYHFLPMKVWISLLYAGKYIAHELVDFECWWQISITIRWPIWMWYHVYPRHRGSPDRRIYYGKMQGHWLRRLLISFKRTREWRMHIGAPHFGSSRMWLQYKTCNKQYIYPSGWTRKRRTSIY